MLADRGFDISDTVWMLQARLHIPSFTKGRSQLALEDTCTIAYVRIHVECGIGVVHQIHSTLQGTLPIEYVSRKPTQDSPPHR